MADETMVVVEAVENGCGNNASVVTKLLPVLDAWSGNPLQRLGDIGSESRMKASPDSSPARDSVS